MSVAHERSDRRFYGTRSMRPLDWTSAEIVVLEAMWQDGKSASEIAEVLPGRTRNSVASYVHRRGLTRQVEVQRVGMSLKPAIAKPKVVEPPVHIIKPARPARTHKPIAGSTPVTLVQRTFGQCAFPFDGEPETLFCGLKVHEERSYCRAHCKVMYEGFGQPRKRQRS